MWYPTLPVLIRLHDQICAAQDVPASISEMSAIDEAILAPQRTSKENRSQEAIGRKCAALLHPLVKKKPFDHCCDRVAYAIAQRFVDRNGFVFRVPVQDAFSAFEALYEGEIDVEDISEWIESNLASRFDADHKKRIFSALNSLAEVKEDLARVAGLDHHVEKIDVIGFSVTQQMASLFRLDQQEKTELQGRFPAFWEEWEEALLLEKR